MIRTGIYREDTLGYFILSKGITDAENIELTNQLKEVSKLPWTYHSPLIKILTTET